MRRVAHLRINHGQARQRLFVVGFLVERLLISFLGVRRVMIDPLEASELQPALDILRLFFRDLLILLDGVPDHFIIHAPLLRITDEARINVA